MAARPETLLITDDKKVLLELGRDGKFAAKSTAWEEDKVFLEDEKLKIFVNRGPGFWSSARRRQMGRRRRQPTRTRPGALRLPGLGHTVTGKM